MACQSLAACRQWCKVRLMSADVAALVSLEDLNLLRELEDRADLAEIRKALKEPGANMLWKDIKKELGI
jgi:hypothetical protein